jgi:murein L,D-transpeptidase YafK
MRKLFPLVLLAFLLVLLTYYFFPEKKLDPHTVIDKLEVIKSKRELIAYSNGEVVKVYTVALGREPLGDKKEEGDHRTPEGSYTINSKNPHSGWYKNLGISYPNEDDIAEAKKNGKHTGGDIKIHALKNGWGFIGKFQRWMDWTAGCIAVTDEEMDELYEHVAVGTPILIRP